MEYIRQELPPIVESWAIAETSSPFLLHILPSMPLLWTHQKHQLRSKKKERFCLFKARRKGGPGWLGVLRELAGSMTFRKKNQIFGPSLSTCVSTHSLGWKCLWVVLFD